MAAGLAAGSDLAGASGAGIARSCPKAEINDRRKHRNRTATECRARILDRGTDVASYNEPKVLARRG
jgi:hypothetical protein